MTRTSKVAGGRPLRRVPLRRCVVCRDSTDKRDLIRLAVDADGRLQLDAKGTGPGRGAYVCQSTACRTSPALEGRLRHALGLGPFTAADRAVLASLSQETTHHSGSTLPAARGVEAAMG